MKPNIICVALICPIALGCGTIPSPWSKTKPNYETFRSISFSDEPEALGPIPQDAAVPMEEKRPIPSLTWGLWVGGLVGAGLGTALMISASASRRAANQATFESEAERLATEASTKEAAGIVAIGMAFSAVGVGVVYWIW